MFAAGVGQRLHTIELGSQRTRALVQVVVPDRLEHPVATTGKRTCTLNQLTTNATRQEYCKDRWLERHHYRQLEDDLDNVLLLINVTW